MTRLEVIQKLEVICKDIFDDENLTITEETVPDDIEEWDSIGHVYLITEIEEEFKIDLSKENGNIIDICSLIDAIINKTSNSIEK